MLDTAVSKGSLKLGKNWTTAVGDNLETPGAASKSSVTEAAYRPLIIIEFSIEIHCHPPLPGGWTSLWGQVRLPGVQPFG